MVQYYCKEATCQTNRNRIIFIQSFTIHFGDASLFALEYFDPNQYDFMIDEEGETVTRLKSIISHNFNSTFFGHLFKATVSV